MSRQYDEQIQVMTVARAGGQGKHSPHRKHSAQGKQPAQGGPSDQDTHWGGEPERFLWRGRLYLVREVLSCWQERQPWWTQQAAAAVQGLEDRLDNDDRPGAEDGNSGNGPDDGSPRKDRLVAADRLTVLADGSERRVWRVRASAGRLAVMGTYDLACAGGGQQPCWWLLHVND